VNVRGGWLSENEVVSALKLLKVIEMGLGGCDASLPPCIAAMLLYLGVVGEMLSCHLEGQQMALVKVQRTLRRDVRKDTSGSKV